MFKPYGNPKAAEITEGTKGRSRTLTALRVVERDGKRYCAWCAEGELPGRQLKYCSDVCRNSIQAWFYPQKEWGLGVLLHRQDWKCNLCAHDWKPVALQEHARIYRGYEAYGGIPVFGAKLDWILLKYFKGRAEPARRPEVDHIIPIFKGGTSIGLDNHQVICYTCHKRKTAADFKKSLPAA